MPASVRGAFATGVIVWIWAASANAAAGPTVVARSAVAADLARQIGGSRIRVELRAGSVAANDPGWTIVGPGGADEGHAPPATDDRHDPLRLDAMGESARALAARLSAVDAAGGATYGAALARFEAALVSLRGKLAKVADLYRGSTVFLIDPLGRPLVDALGFEVVDSAVLKRPPSAAVDSALREDVAERKASILIYDMQAKSARLAEIVKLAKQSDVPTVGLRETLPAALTWQEWLTREINTVQGALNEAAP